MAQNVDWHPELGGVCPACGTERVSIKSSPPSSGGVKVRFHKCACGTTFKSIQLGGNAREAIATAMAEIDGAIKKLDDERERLNRILNYA